MNRNDRFPIGMFCTYVLYFSGQAIYNTYLNLYLVQKGFSTSKIGSIISISTAIILIAQTLWGYLSDRAYVKNRIVRILYIGAACTSLCFYTSDKFWIILMAVTVFGCFFVPIVPLNDNITLQAMKTSKWDYGLVRIGGTIGYAFTVLISGYFLKDEYSAIFMMISSTLFFGFFISYSVPPVKSTDQKKKKVLLRKIFENKNLLVLIVFNLLYGLGESFFHSYYPIYFISIGGNSSLVGWMMFASAISEIPCLFFIHRVIKKIGVDKVLILSGIVTCIRWTLLFVLKSPSLIICTSLLQGIGFAGTNYCLLNYINSHVPEDLRASCQVFKATVSTISSKLIFGFIGGIAYEILGGKPMMLFSAIVVGMGTIFIAIWSRGKTKELSF